MHISRYYALWADYSVTPYIADEFLKDGIAVVAWAKLNKQLFIYLLEERKEGDPATYVKMKDTPWLDNIIQYGGAHLCHNAIKAIKSRKRREENCSQWEDKEEVKLTEVGGLWHRLAVNEG